MACRCGLAFLGLVMGWASRPAALSAPRWRRIPTGSIEPRGWLQVQMQLQSKALTSHLPLFWANVQNTSWLGGNADNVGGLHESTPYWLNGAVPLALQLKDEELLKTVERYIEGSLDRQASDGWLGPDTDKADYWSRYPFLLALAQYHEAQPAGPKRQRVETAATRFFSAVRQRLASGISLAPLSWSDLRAHDLIWTIHYFLDVLTASGAGDAKTLQGLSDLASELHSSAFDWNGQWYNSSSFPKAPWSSRDLRGHGVNAAQSLKRGVVWGRQSGDAAAGFAETWLAWEQLQRYHGQPNGAFAADEFLAGREPNRGTELCNVVESMWSLALAAQLAPRDEEAAQALDALEALALNALPGSLSADLWSHPYLQFANSYQATPNETDHIWANDGPQAAMYGLEPNYECCTANFHQGYPKFTASLFFENPENEELVSAVWAPSEVVAGVGGGVQVELRTLYPFNGSVEYWVQNAEPFTLKVRLPKFLRPMPPSLRCRVEGRWVEPMESGGFLYFSSFPTSSTKRLAVEIYFPLIPRLRHSSDQGISAFLGPLLLALDLKAQRQQVKHYAFDAADWDTRATLSWRLAMPEDPALSVTRMARSIGPRPMAPEDCPIAVEATLVALPAAAWPTQHGAPGPVNGSCPGTQQVRRSLLPYACSSIRISAFPAAAEVLFL